MIHSTLYDLHARGFVRRVVLAWLRGPSEDCHHDVKLARYGQAMMQEMSKVY